MNDIHLAEVAVKVHQIDEIDPDFDGIVFDPWRTHKGINTVSYGDTRGLK
jgi:hypothetical protein